MSAKKSKLIPGKVLQTVHPAHHPEVRIPVTPAQVLALIQATRETRVILETLVTLVTLAIPGTRVIQVIQMIQTNLTIPINQTTRATLTTRMIPGTRVILETLATRMTPAIQAIQEILTTLIPAIQMTLAIQTAAVMIPMQNLLLLTAHLTTVLLKTDFKTTENPPETGDFFLQKETEVCDSINKATADLPCKWFNT